MNAEREDDAHKTVRWWRLLSAIAVANIALFIVSITILNVDQPYLRWHAVVAGIYVAVCAYRSFLPRVDLERTVLVDHVASSVALGRSAATVAEVSFAGQIGLLLHEMGGMAGVAWVQTVAPAVVAALAVAQVFCWSSVLTLSHLGHAIEESIWGLTFAVVGLALWAVAPGLSGTWSTVAWVGVVGAAVYVAFMFIVDVPMYVRRWRADDGSHRLGLVDGFRDAFSRRDATRSWTVWRPEVAWLTGYFSGAVWVSLALLHLPRGG